MEHSGNPNFLIQSPCEALRPFIKRFLVVEFSTAGRDSHLPDPASAVSFCFKGHFIVEGERKAPQAALTGLWEHARNHEHGANSGVVLAVFTAVGAAALMRQPMEELLNSTVALNEIISNSGDVNRAFEQVVEARNHKTRIQAVEDLLLSRISRALPDTLVAAAAQGIEEAHGMLRIDDLARRVGLSQSALERRFRTVTGTSPKAFASIVRVQHVLRLRAKHGNFAAIAAEAGYWDQSHFIKDFKQRTGFAPESFFDRKLSPWGDDPAHTTLD
jgi:AraC-like DNA-binding protein